jgi:hypothetical protein
MRILHLAGDRPEPSELPRKHLPRTALNKTFTSYAPKVRRCHHGRGKVRSAFFAVAERRHAVAEVELTEDTLSIHVRGMDQLWALRSRLEIPLSHVSGAEVAPELAHSWWQGIRSGGTHVPGVITAGTFHQEGERVFWDVHDPEKAIVIWLRDERYARLVIEVKDPPATVAAIQEALGR